MSDPAKAVFLSYASQDAEAAQRICEALRAAGIEVWFDQNELVGGDAWDQKIRRQIGSCALFVPIISANTQARAEGYFRLEWKLADRRTDLIGKSKAFLLPVTIDGTADANADVPDSFLAVQWTKLPAGEVPPAFVARVQQLLSRGAASPGSAPAVPQDTLSAPATRRLSRGLVPALVALGLVMAGTGYWLLRSPAPAAAQPAPTTETATRTAEAARLVAEAWQQLNRPDMARGELAIADTLCRRATELAPTLSDAWAAWSFVDAWYCYHAFDPTPERREGARTKAARARQLAPDSFEARLAHANYLVREGSDAAVSLFAPEADGLLRALLRERPTDARALLSFAILQRNLGHMDEARAALTKMAQDPTAAVLAWHELAWVEFRANRPELALEYEGRSLALQPNWLNLTSRMNLLLEWRGDVTAARQVLDQIPASAMQEDYTASAALGVLYRQRDPAALLRLANSIPREWLLSNWFTGPLDWWRGLAEAQAGRAAAARVRWQSALQLVERRLAEAPASAPLIGWKARLLAVLGDRAEAEKLFQLTWDMGVRNPGQFGRWSDPLLIGQADKVLTELEAVLDAGQLPFWAAGLRLAPEFDALRDLPRFQAIQARLDANPNANYRPNASAAAVPSPSSPLLAPSIPLAVDSKSVAVLAFANLSDDKSNEYFSDGISEELLNVLAKVPGLKVSARTSAFFFKGKEVPIPEIARQLGVAYVVEGSVRKQGDKVRITAQLIKAADGFHVWSDTFTRDLKDIFAVQDEIAGLVAQNLELKLGLAQSGSATAENPEASRLYFEALAAWNQRSTESTVRASDLLTEALRLAPRFARAKALLSLTVSVGTSNHLPGMTTALALQLADEALALDPMMAPGHAARGFALGDCNRLDEAAVALRRAVELDPNYATGHQLLGRNHTAQGRLDESVASLRRAAELDPLSHRILDNYAQAQAWSGDLLGALATLDRALQLQPTSAQARLFRANCLQQLGRAEEALVIMADPDVARASPLVHAKVLMALHRPEEAGALLASARSVFARGLLLCVLGRSAEGWPQLKPGTLYQREFILWEVAELLPRNDPAFRQALVDWGLSEAWDRAEAWRAAHPVITGKPKS